MTIGSPSGESQISFPSSKVNKFDYDEARVSWSPLFFLRLRTCPIYTQT